MQHKKVYGYTLLRPLGVGGMAEVWYAENEIGKRAAVKVLLPRFCTDEAIVERFRNEAKVMVRLDHPNIRQAYDYTTVDGRPCIVMEYLEGEDLATRMKHGERFSEGQLRKWWNQTADALNYTHQQGVVHRDLKPSNIFVDQKGNVKLLDFGIAKIRESISLTQTGSMMGTLMYMSPEQVRDSKYVDYRTDLYSLAASFVSFLAGSTPYDLDITDDYQIRKNIVEIPLDLSGVPVAWQRFLRPYLAKNPEDRPALRAFDAAGDDRGGLVPPVVPKNPASASEKTYMGAATVAAPRVAEEETVAFASPIPNPQTDTNKSTLQNTPKKRKGLIIGIIVAVLVLVGGVMLAKLLVNNPKPEATPVSPVEDSKPMLSDAYVDLGLPSGTLWKDKNEDGFYDFDAAVRTFGGKLPTKGQLEELQTQCQWTWTGSGYKVVGPNGKFIYLPAAGYRFNDEVSRVGSYGRYWSSTPYGSGYAWDLLFDSGKVGMAHNGRYIGLSVRLVQD